MLVVEDYAHDQRVACDIDLHIRCGDLWDRKNIIDAVTYHEVGDRVTGRARLCSIPEVILKGNHDLAAGGVRNTLEALQWADDVTVVADGMTKLDSEYYLAFVPHDDDPAVQAAKIKLFSEKKTDRCRVLFAHAQIKGAKSGSEFTLPGVLGLDDLYLDRWDYVFLGHVHEPQQLAKNCWYVGSQCQRSFQDDGSDRRMFILDSHLPGPQQVALPGPRFKRVRLQSESDWAGFVPDKRTYYRVGIETPAITSDQVRGALDGKCLGVTFSGGGWTPQLAPRLEGTSLRWEDVMAEYVKHTNPPLDQSKLLERAQQLISSSDGI